MDKFTTPTSMTMQPEPAAKRDREQPRMSTIAFLKQFARSYHYEARIQPAALSGIIVN